MTVPANTPAPSVSLIDNGDAEEPKAIGVVQGDPIEAFVASGDDGRGESREKDRATSPTTTPPLSEFATPVANRIVEDSDVGDGTSSSTEDSIVSKAVLSPSLERDVAPTVANTEKDDAEARPNSLPNDFPGRKRKRPSSVDRASPLLAENNTDDETTDTHDSTLDSMASSRGPVSKRATVHASSVAEDATTTMENYRESISHLAPGRKRGRALGKQIALQQLSGSIVRRTPRVGRPPIKYKDGHDTDDCDSMSSQPKNQSCESKVSEAPRRRGRPPKPKPLEGDDTSKGGTTHPHDRRDASNEIITRRGKAQTTFCKQEESCDEAKAADAEKAKDAPEAVFGKRASGKRVRRLYNPNGWSTSILTVRSNVLCLGMSYPCPQSQIRAARLSRKVQLLHPHASVEQAVELVRRNILTEMDGRDLARCLALEANNDVLAYCVSLESGSIYSRRHLKANFNRKSFGQEMRQAWGKVKFRQIILDYFWIPRGSWVMTHWKRSFFDTTLPSFVQEGLLDFGPANNTEQQSPDGDPENTESMEEPPVDESAVVYLPFCLHCIQEVVTAMPVLCKYYRVSFLLKSQLTEHSLWRATSTIDPDSMQAWLGKALNQEDTYCTFKPQEVHHSALDSYVSKDDVVRVLRGIEDFEDVRMIKLKALRKFDPCGDKKACDAQDDESAKLKKKKNNFKCVGEDDGGFVGLKDPEEVERGYDHVGRTGEKPVAMKKEDKRSITPDSSEKLRGTVSVGRSSRSVVAPLAPIAKKTTAPPTSRPKVGRPPKKPAAPTESISKEATSDKVGTRHKRQQTEKESSTEKPAKGNFKEKQAKESSKERTPKECRSEKRAGEGVKEISQKERHKEKALGDSAKEKSAKRRKTFDTAIASNSEASERPRISPYIVFIRRKLHSCLKDYPLPMYEMTSHEREAVDGLLEMRISHRSNEELWSAEDASRAESSSTVSFGTPYAKMPGSVAVVHNAVTPHSKNSGPGSSGISPGEACVTNDDLSQGRDGAAKSEEVHSKSGVLERSLPSAVKKAASTSSVVPGSEEQTGTQAGSVQKKSDVLCSKASSTKNKTVSRAVDASVPPVGVKLRVPINTPNENAPHRSSLDVSTPPNTPRTVEPSDGLSKEGRKQNSGGVDDSSQPPHKSVPRQKALHTTSVPPGTTTLLASSCHDKQRTKGTSSGGYGSPFHARVPNNTLQKYEPHQRATPPIAATPSGGVPGTPRKKALVIESAIDRNAQPSTRTLQGEQSTHFMSAQALCSHRTRHEGIVSRGKKGTKDVNSPFPDGSLTPRRSSSHAWNERASQHPPSPRIVSVPVDIAVQPFTSDGSRRDTNRGRKGDGGDESNVANGQVPRRVYAQVPKHVWNNNVPSRTPSIMATECSKARYYGMVNSRPPAAQIPTRTWHAHGPCPTSSNTSPSDHTCSQTWKVNDGVCAIGVDGCLRSAHVHPQGSKCAQHENVPHPLVQPPTKAWFPSNDRASKPMRKGTDNVGSVDDSEAESGKSHYKSLIETALEKFKCQDSAVHAVGALASSTKHVATNNDGGPRHEGVGGVPTSSGTAIAGGYSDWLKRKKRPKQFGG